MGDSDRVLNPITEFTPPLVLNPITIDIFKELDNDTNDRIENYIKTLKIPFWALCIIENKFIKVRNNEQIIIEYPSFLLIDTEYKFPNDLSTQQIKMIKLIQKIYPDLSDIEVISYIGLLNENYEEFFKNISCCKNIKDEKCYYKCIKKKIKKIICKYSKNTTQFIIGASGVNAINRSNYSITIGNFARNDFAQVKVPDYVKNFYQLNEFLLYLQDNTILKDTPVIKNNRQLLPRYQSVGDDSKIIVQNERIYIQNEYRNFLSNNTLLGTVAYDPFVRTD